MYPDTMALRIKYVHCVGLTQRDKRYTCTYFILNQRTRHTAVGKPDLRGDLQAGAVLQGGVESLVVAVGSAPAACAVA